jgi:polyphosphate kinase 2 (PPK2 family)
MTADQPMLELPLRDVREARPLRSVVEEPTSVTKSPGRLSSLRRQLSAVQDACGKAGIGSIIVVEGSDAAGKSSAIRALTRELDPQSYVVHPIAAPRTHELHAPWLWRFWNRIPRYGQMAIFDESWYRRALSERVDGLISKRQWHEALHDIVQFEQALANDGYVLQKFFLHISRTEQRNRLERLEQDRLHSWRVDADVWQRHQRYRQSLAVAERTLARTATESAPWMIVDATDARSARVELFGTLIDGLERALASQSATSQARGRDAA